MSKQATIASLIRTAAKTESDFVRTVQDVFEEADVERISEFFERFNIPRSHGAEGGLNDPIPNLITEESTRVWGFEEEAKISYGMQRYLDRHERKIKWHAAHPSLEGTENVMLLVRGAIATTHLRLTRLSRLMGTKDELTPQEWATARSLMNKSYLSFRNFLNLLSGSWIDQVQGAVEPEGLNELLGNFYEHVDQMVQSLESHKEKLEERRRQLTVLPEGYPPVKPPLYFHGDLLGKGPWKLYWSNLNTRAHHFREALG